jgi:drug/metabolite transporter (DMT)-like permease
MTIALRHATAHETSPFIYTSVIFAGLIDWIFWNIKPDYISGIGMVVVIIGCVITLLITHKGNTKKI